MAHLLGAENVRVEYPTRTVFESLTVGISEGARIGVVGRNGDGKSTLLRVLAGVQQPDSGIVTHRRGVRVGMLEQGDTLDPIATVGQCVVGDADDHEWASESRVRDVIEGLLDGVAWDARVADLSGGQRRRVALAALLIGDWDIILLDEPTNHLDVLGIAWLARHVNQRWASGQGAFVVVTHDRWFLDAVCTSMWEVHAGDIEPFEGGYGAYVLQRVERDRIAAVSQAKRANLLRKELAWLRRGAPARTSKPKFRIEAATQLIENEPAPRDTVALVTLATQRLGKDVVDLEDVSVTRDNRHVLAPLTWRIAPGERSGILGVNGAGKSTLLQIISGELAPTSGKVTRGKTVKIAVLTQELDALDEVAHERVSSVLARKRTTYEAGGKEMTPAQMLERLGFESSQLSAYVRDLSGGQRRRLQLLLILLDEPNVLILDEPTNDLDTDMLVAMEDLLDTWPGTLLVVSHDRYLLERVTDQQYAILDGEFRHLPRGVDEFLERSSVASASASARSPRGSNTRSASSTLTQPRSSSGAALRQADKERGAIERRISKLREDITRTHELIASHDQTDYLALADFAANVSATSKEIDRLEGRWLELTEFIDSSPR